MKTNSFLKNYVFIICMLIGIVAGCITGALWPAVKDANGEVHYSGVIALSPTSLATGLINNSASKAELVTWLKWMLVYGNVAYDYFN